MRYDRCWEWLAAALLLPGLAQAQTGTPLVNGVPVGVQGAQGSIQAFYLDVPAGLTLLTFGAADVYYGEYGTAHVYVNFGEPFLTGDDPNPVAECVLLEDSYEETCEITNPAAGLWYVEVQGLTEFENYYVGATAATALNDQQATIVTGTNPWYYIDAPAGQKLLYITTSDGIVIKKLGGLFNEVICESFEAPRGVCKLQVPDGGERFYVTTFGNQTGTALLADYLPADNTAGGETALLNADDLVIAGLPGENPGDAAAGSIQTFYLEVPAGLSSLHFITKAFIGGGGDADIFVNYGEPYLTSADPTAECASLSHLSDEGCEILNPAAGRWYVEVYGSTAYSNVGLVGVAATALQNAQALTIAGATGSRNVYYIDVLSHNVQLTVDTSGGIGNPDLYVSQSLFFNFSCGSQGVGTVESCLINAPAGRRYVAVEGVTEYSGVTLMAVYATAVNPFTFIDVSGIEPEDVVESNVITVATNVDSAQPISVTGGEYRIGDGAYVTSAGTVTNGQTVQVRATAGDDFLEAVNVVLTIGGVVDTFKITTRAANSDTVLDPGGNPVVVFTSAGTLMNLATIATPAIAPSAYQYNHGFFAFDIVGLAPGAAVTVTMTLPAGARPTYYVKCTVSLCGTFTGASIVGRVITLTLVDGGAGDSDHLADGTIRDPGAPATLTGGGGGGAMDWLALGLLLAARRKLLRARV